MNLALKKSTPELTVQGPGKIQVAALCFRHTKRKSKDILLITTRDTGRWIIPKGWPIDGLDAPGAAMQEAWEEAGVAKGDIQSDPVGSFHYEKRLGDGDSAVCKTFVFPIEVQKLKSDFPEAEERQRKWFEQGEAANMVQEPELRHILLNFQ